MQGWRRNLRVLWLVQFLTTLAMNLGLVFVPFFLADDPTLRVESESARLLYTGLILAGPFFTTIVFTPLWGWVADRTGPKRQVIRACFGLGATQLLMAVAQSPDQMVAIRMLQGMVSGVLAASLGLVAVGTPFAHQGRAIATLQSATPAGQIFGPVLGGILASACGFRATYALLGSLIVAVGLLSWLLLRQHGFVPMLSANPFRSLWHAGRRALARPPLRLALAVLAGGQFAFTAAQGVFALYIVRLTVDWTGTAEKAGWWNTSIGFTALAMTVTGVASVASSIGWGRLHDKGTRFLTPAGAGVLAASMLLMVAWPTWWVILAARVGIGVGLGAISTLQFAVVARNVAPEERGQLMGVATSMTHIGNLAGFLLGGALASTWSEPVAFVLAAAAYAVVMLAALRLEQGSSSLATDALVPLALPEHQAPGSGNGRLCNAKGDSPSRPDKRPGFSLERKGQSPFALQSRNGTVPVLKQPLILSTSNEVGSGLAPRFSVFPWRRIENWQTTGNQNL
ncbi:MAG: MFS transporter [Gemmataceae bacterium]